jgi:hypothetical protein
VLTAAILARFIGRGVTMLTGWVILRAFFSGFGANILNNIPMAEASQGYEGRGGLLAPALSLEVCLNGAARRSSSVAPSTAP